MYACLAVTCHLHFWQNDRDILRATVVTRGWNGYRNKSQHRKSTLEKKILPPFQQGFEPATFQSRVRCSNHWAIPAPPAGSPPLCVFIWTLCIFYEPAMTTTKLPLVGCLKFLNWIELNSSVHYSMARSQGWRGWQQRVDWSNTSLGYRIRHRNRPSLRTDAKDRLIVSTTPWQQRADQARHTLLTRNHRNRPSLRTDAKDRLLVVYTTPWQQHEEDKDGNNVRIKHFTGLPN